MKIFNILVVFLLVLANGRAQETLKDDVNTKESTIAFQSYGEKIDAMGSISSGAMTQKFDEMTIADTIQTKFNARVIDVCQAKGCWMKLQLAHGKEVMVRFKNYAFFVPKNIAGKEVVVNGLAFVEDMSIEDQKHFAMDEGRTSNEIAQIIRPKRTYSFEADGVLLKE
ncbi:MAG: DUF4920 domain-containing protein [Maribacter sp.]|nr:DUF4920 domain-containing protein [Maribacter sp.]